MCSCFRSKQSTTLAAERSCQCSRSQVPRSGRLSPSADADLIAYALDELGRVVADTVFENGLDLLDVGDVRGRIALYQDQVCLLSFSNRADLVLLAQELRAVER